MHQVYNTICEDYWKSSQRIQNEFLKQFYKKMIDSDFEIRYTTIVFVDFYTYEMRQ